VAVPPERAVDQRLAVDGQRQRVPDLGAVERRLRGSELEHQDHLRRRRDLPDGRDGLEKAVLGPGDEGDQVDLAGQEPAPLVGGLLEAHELDRGDPGRGPLVLRVGLEQEAGGESKPQARAAGCFIDVPQAEAAPAPAVASPLDFSGTPWAVAAPAPECGQHTEEVLLELGYDWETIGALKQKGAIP
jgi:hypothetical protein